MTSTTLSKRCYGTAIENAALLRLISAVSAKTVLDCGCGGGGNARALAERGMDVVGITISPEEAFAARQFCSSVHLWDLEQGLPVLTDNQFDLVIVSHVLEHLFHPERLLHDIRNRVPSGYIAMALPNILFWRCRMQFIAGNFNYQPGGIMDDTHVRFYTFQSGRRLLEDNGFEIVTATVDGSAPLRPLRRVAPGFAAALDLAACRAWPGLFGDQLLYVAKKK